MLPPVLLADAAPGADHSPAPLGEGDAPRSRQVLVMGDDPAEFAPLETVERQYILHVVEACKWNKSKAARILGIGRKTLYRRLESFGIDVASTDP